MAGKAARSECKHAGPESRQAFAGSGWKRFPAAEEWIAKNVTEKPPAATAAVGAPAIDPAIIRAQAAKAAPNDLAEQERLFREFMDWSKTQRR